MSVNILISIKINIGFSNLHYVQCSLFSTAMRHKTLKSQGDPVSSIGTEPKNINTIQNKKEKKSSSIIVSGNTLNQKFFLLMIHRVPSPNRIYVHSPKKYFQCSNFKFWQCPIYLMIHRVDPLYEQFRVQPLRSQIFDLL